MPDPTASDAAASEHAPSVAPSAAAAGGPSRARVVRVDRGAVRVVPADDLTAEPRRAALPRDGLVPLPDGTPVPPAVGDVVDVEEVDVTGGEPRVVALHERRTALVRDSAGRTSLEQVVAANVDVVLVVEHLDPDPAPGRVERLLTLAWRSGARPVVVLTKADLVPDADGMAAQVAELAVGVDVHVVSVVTGRGLDAVRDLLEPGVALVVVGPSGAGKSTLVNAVVGRDVMATGEARADGRGRHTTTHRELVPLPGGAVLIDTPGVRGVGLVAEPDAIDAAFADVAALAAACRFRDCAHETEPGCAVRAAVADGELSERRLTSWRRLLAEAAHQARRADARLAAQERERRKQATREYHRHVRGPRGARG
ncbi:ribosome small subunit-dependent GTPase A [Cellulomonas iranensis]|uniref:ribosome small subunit-dependent GTPase A n=1 Tax=Cellulomonas iranensis TaxID=76862 RepID=UPI001CF3F7B2|nr:ribosome small subunit-dependent GTPase A [Cellulomonas iranensis]UCN15424.1 ribosome small subunit-dependent GTPase A [Cellulomonas iranensis]